MDKDAQQQQQVHSNTDDAGGAHLGDATAARAFDVMAKAANPRQNRETGEDTLNHGELTSGADEVYFEFEGTCARGASPARCDVIKTYLKAHCYNWIFSGSKCTRNMVNFMLITLFAGVCCA